MISDADLQKYFFYVDSLGLSRKLVNLHVSITKKYRSFISRKKLPPSPDSVKKFVAHHSKRPSKFHKKPANAETRRQWTSRLTRFLKFLASQRKIPLLDDMLCEAFQSILDHYFESLVEESVLASTTIRARRNNARRFLLHIEQKGIRDIECANTGLIYDYFGIIHKGTRSNKTAGTVFANFKSFFQFLYRKGYLKRDLSNFLITPRVYKHAGLPKALSEEELERLLASLVGDRPADVRDRAAILLMLVYGLRLGEVTNLTLDCFDWSANRLIVKNRKQGDVLELPLIPSVGAAVVQYLKSVRPIDAGSERLFHTVTDNRPMRSSESLQTLLRGRLRRCGIKVGPGAFRHTLATHLINRGASYEEIASILGHASIESTRIYAKVNIVALREVAENYSLYF